MSDDERPPEITPWGERTEPDTFFGGFWWVSTPRHGGIYLTPEQRQDIPDLIKPHSSDAEGVWWEEDSAWSLPIVYLLSQRPHGSLSDEEEHVLEQAHDTARDSFPDEWEQIIGREIKPGESHNREEGREIALIHTDDLLAGTIWRSSAENSWVPEGMVGVAAYPGEAFLKSNMDPARTHAARYFLIPEAEVKWRTPPFEFNPARHQEVTGREGTPPTQAKEAGQTMSLATHVTVSYKTAAGVEVTSINAVSEEISRELERLKEKLRGADLVDWLEDRGCRLDCSTGPAYMRRDADGSTSEGYLRDGKWHREDGPARIVRNADGVVREQHYFRDGKLHREDGPARVTRKSDGVTEEAYYQDGKLHREDGPAFVRRGSDGSIVREDYRLLGKRVAKANFEEAKAERLKSGSPADAAHMTVTYKTPEGDAVTRIYAIGEDLVREDQKFPFHDLCTRRELNKLLQDRGCKLDCSTGPAVVEHRTDGSIYEEYWRDGRLDREGGPARIERFSDGEVIREDYFLKGERVVKEDAAHMTATYKTPEGHEVTCIYAVSGEIARELESLTEKPGGAALDAWLRDRDCKLDCSTGPAVAEHRADGSSREEYRRDGELHRAEGPARIERGSDGSAVVDYFLRGRAVVKETLEKRAEAETAESPPEKVGPKPTQAKEAESIASSVAASTRIAPYISGSGTVDLMIRVPEPVKSRTDEPKPGTPKQNRTQTKEPPAEGLKKGADREPKPETLEPKADEAHNKAESERQKTRSRPKRDRGWDRDR